MYNKLNDINLTFEDIEDQIKDYSLEFFPSKRVANRKFPFFVSKFYEYLEYYNKIPNQLNFYNYYLNECDDEILNKLSEDEIEGLKARIYRAHPSYVRDIHFAKMLEEKTCLQEVIYNVDLDIKSGIDILIKHNEKEYAVNLFVKTYRSEYFRKKKKKRHEKHNYINIELPIKFNDDCYQVGDFYLYHYKEMIRLFNILLKVA